MLRNPELEWRGRGRRRGDQGGKQPSLAELPTQALRAGSHPRLKRLVSVPSHHSGTVAHIFGNTQGVAVGLLFLGKSACAGCLGRWAAPAAWFVGPGAKWKCRAPCSKGIKDFTTVIAEPKPKQSPYGGPPSTRPGGWPRGWHSLDLSVTQCVR